MRKPHELVNLTCLTVVVSLCQTFGAYAYRALSLEDTCKYTEEALKKNPDNRLLRVRHMQVEEHMNEHSVAREDATILVRRKATTKEEFEQNYTAYIVLGETEKALSCLDTTQKLWPNGGRQSDTNRLFLLTRTQHLIALSASLLSMAMSGFLRNRVRARQCLKV